jgi:hypothetical protein
MLAKRLRMPKTPPAYQLQWYAHTQTGAECRKRISNEKDLFKEVVQIVRVKEITVCAS